MDGSTQTKTVAETNQFRQVQTTWTSGTITFHRLSVTIITHDLSLDRKLKFIER